MFYQSSPVNVLSYAKQTGTLLTGDANAMKPLLAGFTSLTKGRWGPFSREGSQV